MAFSISSSAFNDQGMIPAKYTCDGQDVSPPLQWSDIPANTQSFVLIVDDPDAPVGDWVHCIIVNIPASIHELSEHLTSLPQGAQYAMNSWNRKNYGGPCPPSGTHRYFFKLYALDTTLQLDSKAHKKQVEQAMQGHILGTATLMGTYQRQR